MIIGCIRVPVSQEIIGVIENFLIWDFFQNIGPSYICQGHLMKLEEGA